MQMCEVPDDVVTELEVIKGKRDGRISAIICELEKISVRESDLDFFKC